MAICKICGQEIADNATVCNYCGAAQEPVQTPVQPTVQPTVQTAAPQEVDNGGFLWGLLGCCVPIAGLILFIVWKDTKPKTSKAAGIGALVSVIATVLFYIVYFLLIIILAASGAI